MATSMTGCGEGIAAVDGSRCRVELRAVNNRSFKFSLRAREGFAALEPRAEAAVRGRVRRGTVHMELEVSGPAVAAARMIDRGQLARYLAEIEAFCASHGLEVTRSVDALLALPGVVCDAPPDPDAVDRCWPLVDAALVAALDGLQRMRRAEGAALTAAMRELCGEITGLVAQVRGRVPGAVARHRERLVERVSALLAERGVSLGEADVAREVALVADRSDIAEELVRLESHVAQFDRLLDEESPGRQLEFLSQELAREANTVAAKSTDVEIAHTVVEIKTRVERLREQVQNLE